MNDLATWLRAQLDDDEAHANGWCEDGDSACPMRSHPGHRSEDRVRREVEAKRRRINLITNEYDGVVGEMSGIAPRRCEDLLKLEALPYSDRPGFRDEWRS